MRRPSRKRLGFGAAVVLLLAAILFSLPPARTEYHKWCLNSAKARKARLMGAAPSGMDKFWLEVTGTPISGTELDRIILKHERALVTLGFLHQHALPAQMVSACPQTLETLDALNHECPWYHAETVAATNLLITACPAMLDRWRQRAKKLGW